MLTFFQGSRFSLMDLGLEKGRFKEKKKKIKPDLSLVTHLDQGKEHLSSAMSIPCQLELWNISTVFLHRPSFPTASVANWKGLELQNPSQFLSPALAVYKDFLCRSWALVFYYSWWLKKKEKETQKKAFFFASNNIRNYNVGRGTAKYVSC